MTDTYSDDIQDKQNQLLEGLASDGSPEAASGVVAAPGDPVEDTYEYVARVRQRQLQGLRQGRDRQVRQATANAVEALTQNSQRGREARRLAQENDLPFWFAYEQLDDLKKGASREAIMRALETHPRTREFMLRPENAFSIADGWEDFIRLEEAMRPEEREPFDPAAFVTGPIRSLAGSPFTFTGRTVRGGGEVIAAGDSVLPEISASVSTMVNPLEMLASAAGGVGLIDYEPGQLNRDLTRAVQDAVFGEGSALQPVGEFAQGVSQFAGERVVMPAGEGITGFGEFIQPDEMSFGDQVFDALGQIGTAVALSRVPGGSRIAAGAFTFQGVDQQAQTMRSMGLDPAENADAMLLGGAVTGVSERLRLGRIERILPRSVRRSGIGSALARIFFESGEEATQEAIENAGQNLVTFIYDEDAQIFEGVGEAASVAGVASAIFQSIVEVALPGKSRADRTQAAVSALDQARAVAATMETTAQSRETVEEFIQEASDDAEILISAEGVETLYQSEEGLQALDDMGVTDEQIASAVTEGADVPVAVGRLTTSEFYDQIRDHVRQNPEAPTVAEQEADALKEFLDVDTREAARAIMDEVRNDEDLIYIQDELAQRLERAGRSADEARAEGQIYAAFFNSLSGKIGESAREIFDRVNPQVTGAPQQAAQEGTVTFNQFAGVNALTADTDALAQAESRLEAGEDANAVRQETGWFRGVDGEMRFEISDSGMRFVDGGPEVVPGAPQVAAALDQFIEHDELFAAYPAIRDLPIGLEIDPDADGTGQFNGFSIQVRAQDREQLRAILAHEIQHYIQQVEGFARGGAPAEMAAVIERAELHPDVQAVQNGPLKVALSNAIKSIANSRGYEPLVAFRAIAVMSDPRFTLDAVGGAAQIVGVLKDDAEAAAFIDDIAATSEWQNYLEAMDEALKRAEKFDRVDEDTRDTPWVLYARLAGEVEARDTQARVGLLPGSRVSIAPESVFGPDGDPMMVRPFAPEQQIILRKGERALSGPTVMYQSAVPIASQPLSLEGTGRGGRVLNKDIAQAFTDRHNAEHGGPLDAVNNPEHYEIVKDSMREDLEFQISRVGVDTGLGWYVEDVADAMNRMRSIFPELADPVKRDLFIAFAAITSPRERPIPNWEKAALLWERYSIEGTMPTVKPNGKLFGTVTKSIKLMDYLVQSMGEQGAVEFMFSTHSGERLAEVRRDSGVFKDGDQSRPVADYLANETNKSGTYMGANMFGPKVGDFMLNATGVDPNAITVDIWNHRTWDRLTGQLQNFRNKAEREAGITNDEPRKGERDAIERMEQELAAEKGLQPSSVQALLWYYEQKLYRDHGVYSPSQSFSDGAKAYLEKRETLNAGQLDPRTSRVARPSGQEPSAPLPREAGARTLYQDAPTPDGSEAGVEEAFQSTQKGYTLDQIYEVAARLNAELNDDLAQAADEVGAVVQRGPLKKRETAEDKMRRKNYEHTGKLADIMRGTILIDTPQQYLAIRDKLAQKYDILDEGWRMPSKDVGYFDAKMTVRFPNGMLGEVQLMPPGMFEIKHRGEGHRLYEMIRAGTDVVSRGEIQEAIKDSFTLYRLGILNSPSWRLIFDSLLAAKGNISANRALSISLPLSITSPGSALTQSPDDVNDRATMSSGASGNVTQTAGRASQFQNRSTFMGSPSDLSNVSDEPTVINRQDTRDAGRGQPGTGQAESSAASPSEPVALEPLEGAPRVQGEVFGPIQGLVSVAEQYAQENGIDLRRQSEFVEIDEDRARRIADAYEAMEHAPQDPAVREAYAEMIRQTRAQYDALVAAGYEFWFIDMSTDAGVDYVSSPWNAMRDIRDNKRMGVFPTLEGFGTLDQDVEDNPMLEDTGLTWPAGSPDGDPQPVLANDLFRAVHDAFGHGLEGAGFRARGEENAWQAHVRLFTGAAVGAITSETRGQNSWLNYGPYGEQNRTASAEDTVFADQKTGLMPEWTWSEGRAGDMAVEVEGRSYDARRPDETLKEYMKREIDTREQPDSLPFAPDRFFDLSGPHMMMPMDVIVSSKSAEENRQGGGNAAKRFLAAYDGVLPPRDPITVTPQADGTYRIVDGNGTFTAFQEYGWPEIPVQVVGVHVLNTETEAFRRWFGDSKVVDENGDPLVVYHYSGSDRDFESFIPLSHFGTQGAANDRFNDTEQNRRREQDDGIDPLPRIIPAYLALKNPLELGREKTMEVEGGQMTGKRLDIPYQSNSDLLRHVADRLMGMQMFREGAEVFRLVEEGPADFDIRPGATPNSHEKAIEVLQNAGFDGITYINALEDAGSKSFVAFSPEQIKSVSNRGTFDADDPRVLFAGSDEPSGPRGMIEIPAEGVVDGQAVIRLTEAADQSTFLHESAHLFLEIYAALEGRGYIEVDNVMSDVRSWLGVPPGRRIERAEHEKFAESFEAYLARGKAPSPELKTAFSRFSKWLKDIYRQFRGQMRNLDPEAIALFDRLLTTDAAVGQNELNAPRSLTEAMEGIMTDEEIAKHSRLVERAGTEARDKIVQRIARKIERANTRQVRERLRQLRDDATEELAAQPLHKTMQAIFNGELPQLDRDAAEALVGEDVLRRLPRGKRGLLTSEGGETDLDTFAQLNGFNSASGMLNQMAGASTLKRDAYDLAQRRAEAEGIQLMTDDEIEAAALQETFSTASADILQNQLNALARKAAIKGIPLAAIKAEARDRIENQPIDEVIKPGIYAVQSRARHKKALREAAKGNWELAVRYMQQALLQHEMARLAYRARDEIQRGERRVRRFNPSRRLDKTRYAPEIIERIHQVFRLPGGSDLREVQSLNDWAQANPEWPVILPPEVAAGRLLPTQRGMTLAQFRGWRDSLLSLGKLARDLSEQKAAERKAANLELAESIEQNAGKKHAQGAFDQKTEKERRGVLGFLRSGSASVRRLSYLGRLLDGGPEAVGLFFDRIIAPLREASNNELDMRTRNQDWMEQWFDKYSSVLNLNKNVYSEALEAELTGEQVFSIILNMGNADNIERLLNERQIKGQGVRFTRDNLQALLDEFGTPEVMSAAQEVWDHIDSYWPQISALEQRTTGVTPTKVEASPVTAQGQRYRGGYYPIAYDPTRVDAGSPQNEGQNEFQAEIEKGFSSTLSRAQTRHGHTQARLSTTGRSVHLSISVLWRHLDNVAHDLAMREVFNEVGGIIGDGDVGQAIQNALGEANNKAIRDIILRMGTGRIVPRGPVEKMFRRLRTNAVAAMLGASLRTILTQPLGLTQSIAKLGIGRVAEAVGQMASDPKGSLDFVMESSSFMRERSRIITRDIKDAMVGETARGVRTRLTGYALKPMQWVDTYAVAAPTWIAAYNEAIEDRGFDHNKAARYADQIVADTQGSGETMDLSTLQSGSELEKMFTFMFGYFSGTLNLTYEATQNIARGDVAKGAMTIFLIHLVQGALSGLMLEGLGGEEDDPLEQRILMSSMMGIMNQFVGSIPLGREFMAGLVYGNTQDTPLGRAGDQAVRTVQSLRSVTEAAIEGDLEARQVHGLVKNGGNAAGLWFGVPGTYQATRMYDTIMQDDDPTVMEVLLTGKDQDN